MKAIQRYIPKLSVLALLLVAHGSCSLGAQSGATSLPAQKGAQKGVQQGTKIAGEDGAPGSGAAPVITEEASGDPVVGSNKDRKIPDGCWFNPIHLDFGTFVENTKQIFKGTYKFENKSKDPQKITNITPSCKCQDLDLYIKGKKVVLERKNDPSRALKNEILVPPGAKGRIEMTFDVTNDSGTRTGDIRFDTSDPAMPSFVLTCEVDITPAFVVDPGVVQLGIMSPNEKKEWSVKVRSSYYKDDAWKITKADAIMPKGMIVSSYERKKDDIGVYWEVRGSYGPKLDEGAFGGSVVLHSDHEEHKILVQVIAEVKQKSDLTRKILEFKPFDRNVSQADGRSRGDHQEQGREPVLHDRDPRTRREP